MQVHLMGKPALVIYEEALQLLGMRPEEVVAIGDSLVCYTLLKPREYH
jgi:FMN phosphatase YigB (HAD superfamily)